MAFQQGDLYNALLPRTWVHGLSGLVRRKLHIPVVAVRKERIFSHPDPAAAMAQWVRAFAPQVPTNDIYVHIFALFPNWYDIT